MDDLLEGEPNALSFVRREAKVVNPANCHAKSLLHPGFRLRSAERWPGLMARLLDTGCCGIAGARVTDQPNEAVVVASGTSCRNQIDDLTPIYPQHIAELLDA